VGIYRTICYKVEDLFVNVLSKNQNPAIVREKVLDYRNNKEIVKKQRKGLVEKNM
jgi:hypothetical protein